MKLDDRMLRLIAVGASITANCQPCLQTSIKKALENGADEQEIAEAVEVGKTVRRGAAFKLDQFALSLTETVPSSVNGVSSGCECQA